MTNGCSACRSLIPRAIAGDISAEEQQSLGLHLSECPVCSKEHEEYADVLRQMRSVTDVPVPKHFFVYAEERAQNPWRVFRGMSFAWQGAVAAAAFLLCVAAGAAALRLNVRAENGAWVVSFGEPAPARIIPAPVPVVDTAAIEARVMNAVEERNRREQLEWVRTLRAEIARSGRSMTEQQSRVLQAALSEVEARLDNRIATTADALEARSTRSLNSMYRTVTAERERDLETFNNRFSRFAANDEVRSNQTDAILETLLQVAELKVQ